MKFIFNQTGRLRLALSSIGAACVLTVCGMSIAFDPDSPVYGHSHITRTVAEDGFTLKSYKVDGFTARLGDGNIGFSADAVDQLELGARSVDFMDLGGFSVEGAGKPDKYLYEEFGGGLYLKGLPDDTDAHCDDEDIVNCSIRIFKQTISQETAGNPGDDGDQFENSSAINLLKVAYTDWNAADVLAENGGSSDAISSLQSRALRFAVAARIKVGRSLHTTQDFYAHSNWAESNDAEMILTDLGKSDSKAKIENRVAPKNSPTCKQNLATPEVLNRMRNYYNPLTDPLKAAAALDYANYAANSSNVPALPLAIATLYTSGVSTLKEMLTFENSGGNWDINEKRLITSGYFLSQQHAVLGIGSATDDGFEAKCDHGFFKAGILNMGQVVVSPKSHLAGINKDAPWAPFAPNPFGGEAKNLANPSELHAKASYQAAKATWQIYQNMIDAIEDVSGFKNADTAASRAKRDLMVQLFMGMKPTIAFVVDTTGSMQDIMDGITSQIEAVAKREEKADSKPMSHTNLRRKFMLVTYSENNENVAQITQHVLDKSGVPNGSKYGSAQQLVDTLKALPPASGGGDCREPTLSALLATVKRVPIKSKIFVFTDASAKNSPDEATQIKALVTKKKLDVTFSVSGSCSPIDENYKNLAQASGGQLLLVDHSSGDTAVALAAVETGDEPMSLIHMEQASLSAGARREVMIPVENALKTLLISVTSDVPEGIVVTDPAGKTQIITPFLGGGIFKINQPAAGNWKVAVSGYALPSSLANPYTIKAQAIGQFDLASVSYSSKEMLPEALHEQHVQYGVLPPTTLVRVQAKLTTNAANNPNIYLWQAIAEDGSLLGNIDMSRLTPDQYEGSAAIDAISLGATRQWRVRVSGVDAAGKPFARMYPVVQHATRLLSALTAMPSYLVAGSRHRIKINVQNFGAADSFAVEASTTLGQVQSVNASADVAAGGQGSFWFDLSLPKEAVANSAGVLSIAVKSRLAGNAVVTTHNIPLFLPLDTDGDGVPDREEKGRSGSDENYDGNGDGIPDWKQANVISLHSHTGKAYVTASVNAGGFKLGKTQATEGVDNFIHGLDLFDFKVVGVSPGASVQVNLVLPSYLKASGFDIYGAEVGNSVLHWYDFAYKEEARVGAKLDRNIIALYLTDGAKGDGDMLANGEIAVLGAPTEIKSGTSSAVSANQPSTGTTPTPTPGATTPPVGGKSGGCTIGDPAQRDMSLPLLCLFATGGLLYRRRRAASGPAGKAQD